MKRKPNVSGSGYVTLPIRYVRELIEATTDTRSLLDCGLDVEIIKNLDKRLDRIEGLEDKLSDEARDAIDLFNPR